MRQTPAILIDFNDNCSLNIYQIYFMISVGKMLLLLLNYDPSDF